jgi:hypothetical protein
MSAISKGLEGVVATETRLGVTALAISDRGTVIPTPGIKTLEILEHRAR